MSTGNFNRKIGCRHICAEKTEGRHRKGVRLRCSVSLLKLDMLRSKILTDTENMQKHSYVSGVEQRLGVVLYASPYLRVATIAQ